MRKILEVFNMDALAEGITAGIIEISRFPNFLKTLKIIPNFEKWEPGKKLKILLCGYNGAKNIGADVRVKAMVDQFYHILGNSIEISIMTLSIDSIKVYFNDNRTNLIEFNSIFFKDLLKAASSHHIAVMSEGACFKSTFANALTVFMTGAAGIMDAQGKKCIAYGSEAGYMDWLLKSFVRHYCKNSYIISRTEPSKKELEKLGLKSDLGTDTAWIFQPQEPVWAEKTLRNNGWDGKKPIIGLVVVNPFIWPIRPSLSKFISMKIRKEKNRADHYQKWYFFSTSPQRDKAFKHYISSLANSVNKFIEKYDVFPVIIGIEKLDFQPCQELQKRLKVYSPIFCAKDYDGYQIMSIIWKLKFIITSDYHGCVLSMTGGVPSGGISMDERIDNIMEERGHLENLCLKVDDPELEIKNFKMMEYLWENEDKIKEEILRTIPYYLKKMAEMGRMFKNYIRKNFPGLPLPDDPQDWKGYLPPLYPELQKIVDK